MKRLALAWRKSVLERKPPNSLAAIVAFASVRELAAIAIIEAKRNLA